MAQHFIEKCLKCDTVIRQCRCPALDKEARWGYCDECKNKVPAQEYEHPPCKECGTPPVVNGTHSLVLYFGSEADAREFVAVVKEALPGLEGYQIGTTH